MRDIPPIPEARLDPDEAGFRAALERDDRLIHFVLNVGDGDTQLILLPSIGGAPKRALVVDIHAGTADKLMSLIEDLVTAGVLAQPSDGAVPSHRKLFPIVVGTHPHRDHIGGMAEFLDRFGNDVAEYWDPGYYHPIPSYFNTLTRLENNPQIAWSHPTSGFRRFVDDVRVSVLGPSLALRHRFDTYGVHPNDASVTLKLDYAYRRVEERRTGTAERLPAEIPDVNSLILGADTQARAWARVLSEFPRLSPNLSPIFQHLEAARGVSLLEAHVIKVPHHASKNGAYFELVKHLRPKFAIVSSAFESSSHRFPHEIAQEAIREARQPIVKKTPADRLDDWQLGLFYTADRTDTARLLGSIAVVFGPTFRTPIRIWRFTDDEDADVVLSDAESYDTVGTEPRRSFED